MMYHVILGHDVILNLDEINLHKGEFFKTDNKGVSCIFRIFTFVLLGKLNKHVKTVSYKHDKRYIFIFTFIERLSH